MWVEFKKMPPHSRLWVYQVNRKLTPSEGDHVEKSLLQLCESWKAHGFALHASYQLIYSQFIVLAVNESETGASGCSIDSSVHHLKELQQQLGLDLFDRSQVAFLINNEVILYKALNLRKLFESGALKQDSLTFNNAVSSLSEFETQWKIPVDRSWLAKYLPKTTLQE